MKTSIINRSLLGLALALTAAGCTNGDKFDYDKNVVFITGTEVTPVSKFVVEDTPATQIVSVSTSYPVEKDTKVTVAIDAAKLEAYNKANGTSYFCVPDGSAQLEATEVIIPKGRAYSDPIVVRVVSTENFEEGRTYVVPVAIQSVEGVDILEAESAAYLQIARVLEFMSLDMSNTNMYSNYIFPDNLMKTLGAFTYEVKCYSEDWHRIARLCSFTSKDEQKSSMLRFGENGYPVESLQWVSPGGSIVSNKAFSTNTWYMISLVYDGNALIMYVDGVKDAEGAYSGTVDFQRIELGMSWGGYRASQYFRGRMCEMRVWDHARTPGEIKNSLCGVDPQSEGLVAYWKFNEGQGYIFNDATGHGYTMDWKDTSRDVSENGVMVPTPDAANAVQWVEDDKNKCSE